MPLRPCLGVHGHVCNKLTPNRRCADCQAEIQRRTNTARPSWVERYGPDWPRISAEVIADQPACVLCGQEGGEDEYGQPNPLTAGHKISRRCGGSNDRDNLQTECRRCNSRKTCECPRHSPPPYRIR
ncbi:HNH endonuclease [Nocardiopsis dassonvillei]|uniref:HNH endonuclease n=1 Tax=Nocardiopsis dassonvillei TaxID=2014 RepID=UPI00363A0B33